MMALEKIIFYLLIVSVAKSFIIDDKVLNSNSLEDDKSADKGAERIDKNSSVDLLNEDDIDKELDGVYSECVLHMSFSCIQKKTLRYLVKLNQLKEVSVIGDYLKFVKIKSPENSKTSELPSEKPAKISTLINRAIDMFFENRVLRLKAIGKEVSFPINGDEFVGRKKRKGGGGGGGGGGGHGHGGDDDGGKKKMMMMAMMCMKMKFMMMVPAMMGMMGMMSFKSMMFSMMSFMMTKMMLMMKLHEKKVSLGGGGDGGWAAGGGGGGAWMPAGGPDYGGNGGGGGGYDSNAQWQGRSNAENAFHHTTIHRQEYLEHIPDELIPLAEKAYIKPEINLERIKKLFTKPITVESNMKSRKKRGVIDVLHSAYVYWINKILGINRYNSNYPKYKVINGLKYIYYPVRQQNKKLPKAIPNNQLQEEVKNPEEFKPIAVQDFNKGEIVDQPMATARMHKKKMQKFKQNLEDAVEENPWE